MAAKIQPFAIAQRLLPSRGLRKIGLLPHQTSGCVRYSAITIIRIITQYTRLSTSHGANIAATAFTVKGGTTVVETHKQSVAGIVGKGRTRPIPERGRISEIYCVYRWIWGGDAVINDKGQFLDGGHPPVAVAAIVDIIQRFKKLLGIIAIALGSRITAIGGRVAVVPCVIVVRIMGIGVVCLPILGGFHLPDQPRHIVSHHNPERDRTRQHIAAAIQFSVRHRVDVVTGILPIKWLAR